MPPLLHSIPLGVVRSSLLFSPRRFLTNSPPRTATTTRQYLIPHTRHHAFHPNRSFATTPSPTLSSEAPPRPPQPDTFGGFFLSPLLLQLLSGTFFLFAGYALHTLLSPPPRDTSLKPSLVSIAEQSIHQPTYGSKSDYHAAIEELRRLWAKKGKDDRVSIDEDDLESHGISDWSYHEEKRPSVVVWVEDTKEVQEVVVVAQKYKVPITPFSGGTSLEGHYSSVSDFPSSLFYL